MTTAANILNIETHDINPMGSGRYHPAKRLPMTSHRNDELPEQSRLSLHPGTPLVINRRFLSGAREARIVSTYFSDEFCLAVSDSVWWGTSHMEIIGNDNEWIVLSLRLSGDTLESVCGQHHRLDAYTCYMVHYARGMNHVLRALTDEPMAEACITFRPSLLAEKLGIPRWQTDRLLHPGSDVENPWFSRCDMTPRMAEIIRELQGCCPSEPTYRLHAEARALELTALYLDQVRAQDKPLGPRGALSRDLRCLYDVKRYLEEHYDQEPKIDVLCRAIGFNRRKLTSGFKREFGKTIHEYHQEIRMEIAKALFRGQTANVSLVAEKIGYAFPGNFAKAFQKYTGMSPKAYAKRHFRVLR